MRIPPDYDNRGAVGEQNHPVELSPQKGSWVASFGLAEQILKIAGLLAVFGYMELRAHLNYLGVSSTAALGAERYLAEFYAMATDLLFRAQVLSALILPVLLITFVAFLGLRVLDRKDKMRQAAKGSANWLGARSASPWLPGILLLLLIAFQLWFLAQLSKDFSLSPVIGELKPTQVQRARGQTLFSILFWVLASGGLLNWALSARRKQLSSSPRERIAQSFWSLQALLLAILGLVYLPNLYGAFERDASYPRISVKSEMSGKMCGLLVLQSGDEMRIWTASNKIGRIVIMKPSDSGLVITGASDDLIATSEKAMKGEPFNYCPD
jgi:hypothetical protein